jgi:predicted transport protein
MTKIRGYLKLSISVLHDNDPRVELKSVPESTNCFIPSQIKVEYRQLSIYLIKAEELPDMDSLMKKKAKNRQCDPYVEFKYFGLNVQSKVTQNINDVAIWNQIINIPIQFPIVSQKIVLLIKDWDEIGKNDNIGSYEIKISDIIGNNNKYANYTYIDIYGSSKNKKDNINNLMNTNAEIGSAWNGRILLKIDYKITDTPITKAIDLRDDNELKLANSVTRSILWTVYVKLYCAYYLPKEYKKYSIKIIMQNSQIVF